MSFTEITDKFKIAKKHYYKYCKLGTLYVARVQGLAEPELTNLEKCVSKPSLWWRTHILFLLLGSQESSTSRLAMWEQDLGLKID